MTPEQARQIVEALQAGGIKAGSCYDEGAPFGGQWVIDWMTPHGYRVEIRGSDVAIWSPAGEPEFTTDMGN